jgi:signal transduction histidine kinase
MMPLLYERFERFERLEHSNTDDDSSTDKAFSNKVEGSGLGLSIVQRIMTHMGWELTHQANATGGSTFSIYYR